MDIDITTMISDIIEHLQQQPHIRPGQIPDIDLYMDQVTSFMDDHLKESRRHAEDKILTKTMINNYTKNRLLPPPEKKRYSKEHLLIMIFIYYMKGFLSLDEIKTILNPINQRYFHSDSGIDVEKIYSEIYKMGKGHLEDIQNEVMESYRAAETSFSDVSDEDRTYLQTFSFIGMLCYDIYLRKLIIGRLVDQWNEALEKKGRDDNSSRGK